MVLTADEGCGKEYVYRQKDAYPFAGIVCGRSYRFWILVLSQSFNPYHREENFSVELPRSLEKETTIDYAAQSSDGTVKANGKYADVNSDFQYMILDYSSLAGETTDILTEKLFVTYMKGNLKSQFGSSYKEVYADGNKLKMTYRAKTGDEVYNYAICKKSGYKYYWFVFGCKADEKDFYDPKFEKWASTIHIN